MGPQTYSYFYLTSGSKIPEEHEAHGVGAVHVAVEGLDQAQHAVLHQQLLLLRGAAQVGDYVRRAVLHLVVGDVNQGLQRSEYVAIDEHFAVAVVYRGL